MCLKFWIEANGISQLNLISIYSKFIGWLDIRLSLDLIEFMLDAFSSGKNFDEFYQWNKYLTLCLDYFVYTKSRNDSILNYWLKWIDNMHTRMGCFCDSKVFRSTKPSRQSKIKSIRWNGKGHLPYVQSWYGFIGKFHKQPKFVAVSIIWD